jgi:hypothetical protein
MPKRHLRDLSLLITPVKGAVCKTVTIGDELDKTGPGRDCGTRARGHERGRADDNACGGLRVCGDSHYMPGSA